MFYAEYNIRLFFWLLLRKTDFICAIDLDTILPCLFVSKIKRVGRIYDAHELFTELKEVKTSRIAGVAWRLIERVCVPRFQYGYTVSNSIAHFFEKKYGVHYATIRNLPLLQNLPEADKTNNTFIYSGAVNEARGFEVLIPAMQFVNHRLIICGDGNFMQQAKQLAAKYKVEDKIEFKGMLLPEMLQQELKKAYIGINLVENTGLNQYYSLANKFFDYIQLGIPQISMNFPEYKKINDEYNIATLIDDMTVNDVANAMNKLMEDVVLYKAIQKNCFYAAKILTWQNEEIKLLEFYKSISDS